jgi:O-antigen/teichoic acid export membrane protein
VVIPVPWGGLQGLQKFGSLALNLVINGGSKCVLGIAFVSLGLGICGALSAVVISYFLTTLLSYRVLRMSLDQVKRKAGPEGNLVKNDQTDFSKVYAYSLPVGLTLLCFMVLTNVDLIWVKHFFLPIEAGYYSIAQMVGKIIFIFSFPIVMTMFPKMAMLRMENQEEKARVLLGRSLIATTCLCGGATLISFFFPSLIIQVLSGEVYVECIPLVGIFSMNMTIYSLSLVLLHYQLSADRRGFLYPLVLCTLIQSGLIVLFHKNLVQVLLVTGGVGIFLLAINIYLIYQSDRGKRTGERTNHPENSGSIMV